MKNDIHYFTKSPTGWHPVKTEQPKGLLAYKPSPMWPRPTTYSVDVNIPPKSWKDIHAELYGYARPSSIKRTRKRLSYRAAMMDHTSVEWSQWWPKPARKPKRWKQ